MANARSRLKETRSTKTPARSRVVKREKIKKSPPKLKTKQPKDETKTTNRKRPAIPSTDRSSRSSLSASDEKKRGDTSTRKAKITNGKSKERVTRTTLGRPEQINNSRKKSRVLADNNLTDILAQELTKKTNRKLPKSLPERAAQEPWIITMENTPANTDTNTFASSAGTNKKQNKKQRKVIHNEETKTTEAAKITPRKQSTSPKTPGPCAAKDTYMLPVSAGPHKVNRIENINMLRQMLSMRKIQLSNGVQITVPTTTQPAFECDHCGRAFRAKQDLRKHVLIHLDVKPFPCPLCPSRFRQRGNLKTHMTRKHAAALPSPEQFICHHCGARFYVKEAIRAHVLKHEPRREYRCPHCPKLFARDVYLRAHMRAHHGGQRFYCYLCSASYLERAALDAHIKRHLGVRDLACHLCGKAFARLDCIKKHIAALHRDVKRFQCPVCFKWLKGHLREHMRTHVHSKPYACLECGKRFAQTSQLSVHKRSHTGVKPYVCRVCKRPFSHSNALVLHIRIHTGEKPFECAMCPLAFSQLPHMKAHMLNIHNKMEAYKCNDCGQFFKLLVTLNEHRKKCANGAAEATPWLQALSRTGPPDDPTAMSLSRMRFLLAILLQTIADKNRLHILGFNKRLIDHLLVDSLEATGHRPSKDPRVPPAVRLRDNIRLLLEWTVPADTMRRFRSQNKSTEQILDELTR